jgi:protein TonB
VVTRAPAPDDPLDFTDRFVTGSGQAYVGGTTAAGTLPVAVRVQPSASGRALGAGTAPAPPAGPDRSRRPVLGGGPEWKCPFPPEADVDPINHAVVTIRVDVAASGTVVRVSVTKDPGHGFGREARACALAARWSPALDRGGDAVAGTTTVNVRFDR